MTIEARRGRLATPAAALALASCGMPAVIPPQAGHAPARAASTQPAVRPGPSNGVIGVDARGLIRQFGEPRLDIRDPAARKLQFGNERCVLDAYLYPPKTKREPVVTFAEARKSDGTAMDWADCASALKRK